MSTQLGLPARLARATRPPTRAGRQYAIRTFGCQMNQHDSERLAGLLEADGMVRATDVANADLVLLNTCCIRENADDRLYGTLGHLKTTKAARPGMQIAVGGCLAQKDGSLVRERAPWVDVVFGTHNLARIVDLLDQAAEWGPVTEVLSERAGEIPLLPGVREESFRAWVTIMVGCNNACTFCIVPHVRGREISRRPQDVIAEVRQLVADGVIEITLLGQNVNSYGRDLGLDGRRPLFAPLLRQLGEIEGLRRIFFTSPHPKDFRQEVAAAMAETPAVCEQLHLPVQSGSDRILARMHRGYTAARFMEKVEMARRQIAGVALSTDVIVGFPGETEDDFAATLQMMEAARFDSAFTFIYSPRPGTAAAEMVDDFLPAELLRERYLRLTQLQDRIALEANQRLVGEVVEVLIEGPSRKDPAVASARTRGNKLIHLATELAPGSLANSRVVKAAPHHLVGVVC